VAFFKFTDVFVNGRARHGPHQRDRKVALRVLNRLGVAQAEPPAQREAVRAADACDSLAKSERAALRASGLLDAPQQGRRTKVQARVKKRGGDAARAVRNRVAG
jgi:hypothetical protein